MVDTMKTNSTNIDLPTSYNDGEPELANCALCFIGNVWTVQKQISHLLFLKYHVGDACKTVVCFSVFSRSSTELKAFFNFKQVTEKMFNLLSVIGVK